MSASFSSILPLHLCPYPAFFFLLSSSCSLPPYLPPTSSLPPAAGTTASSNAGAMNSLTSLGTLQGLAGATVGLNNINALAGSVNSEYSPCHQPLHLHLHFQPPMPTYLPATSLQKRVTRCRETKCYSHTMQQSLEFDGYGFLKAASFIKIVNYSYSLLIQYLLYDKYERFTSHLNPSFKSK